MKIGISLPEADVTFLDEYAQRDDRTRSAVLHQAITMLRDKALENDYEAAWDEWYASPDAALWETTVGDGLDDDAHRDAHAQG